MCQFLVYSKVIWTYIYIYMYVCILFIWILFNQSLLQNAEYSSLCYTAHPCCSSVFKNSFIYFLAVLGLHHCALAFSSCGECGLLRCSGFLLRSTGSRVLALQLQLPGLRAQAQQFWHTGLALWDLPGSGIEPASSELAGRFFTTELPGKPLFIYFIHGSVHLFISTVDRF